MRFVLVDIDPASQCFWVHPEAPSEVRDGYTRALPRTNVLSLLI